MTDKGNDLMKEGNEGLMISLPTAVTERLCLCLIG